MTAVLAAGSFLLLAHQEALALLTLEFDFQTAPIGADVAASFATGGASAVGELKNGDTVNTSSTGMSYASSAALRNGYLVTLQPGSGNSPGLDTKDTGGANNRWDDYMGTTAYGSGTAVVVYRPHYTNDGGAETARRSLIVRPYWRGAAVSARVAGDRAAQPAVAMNTIRNVRP